MSWSQTHMHGSRAVKSVRANTAGTTWRRLLLRHEQRQLPMGDNCCAPSLDVNGSGCKTTLAVARRRQARHKHLWMHNASMLHMHPHYTNYAHMKARSKNSPLLACSSWS
eukprot:1152880-Pelagomonas_calceolata.AAC.10